MMPNKKENKDKDRVQLTGKQRQRLATANNDKDRLTAIDSVDKNYK